MTQLKNIIMNIKQNIEEIKKTIAKACNKTRRKPEEITIVAATKGREIKQIKEAVSCGITDIGESTIQELEEKYPDLKELGTDIHFIGHLQSNKVKKAVQMCDYIQSVDSLDLLRKIHYASLDMEKIQNIFLQVNTSNEPQKYGMKPEEVESMLTTMKNLPYNNVKFIGLMTIAPLVKNPEEARPYFQKLWDIKESLNLKHLSMGMSNDYEIAIEEGATVIRIGRKIFE